MKIDEIERSPKGYRGKLLGDMIAAIKEVRPLTTPHMRYEFTPDGYFAQPTRNANQHGTWTPKQPFDLADLTMTNFSVMDNMGRSNFFFRGARKTIGDDVGIIDWDSDAGAWKSATLTGEIFVYLVLYRSSASIKITCTSSLPEGNDSVEVYPLWFIGWIDGGGIIDRSEIVDMRYMYHLSGMG